VKMANVLVPDISVFKLWGSEDEKRSAFGYDAATRLKQAVKLRRL